MALLPESCCNRDLASYYTEEKIEQDSDPATKGQSQGLSRKQGLSKGGKPDQASESGCSRANVALTSASASRPKNMSEEMALAPANFCRASFDSTMDALLSASFRLAGLRR